MTDTVIWIEETQLSDGSKVHAVQLNGSFDATSEHDATALAIKIAKAVAAHSLTEVRIESRVTVT